MKLSQRLTSSNHKPIPRPVQHSVELEADRCGQRPGYEITFPRSSPRRRQKLPQFAAVDQLNKIIGTPNQNPMDENHWEAGPTSPHLQRIPPPPIVEVISVFEVSMRHPSSS